MTPRCANSRGRERLVEGVDVNKSIPPSRLMHCASCGGDMWKSRTSQTEGVARCRPCRTGVHGVASKYDAGCRCGPCRQASTERHREYRARRAAGGNPVTYSRSTVSTVCAHCGSVFEARSDLAKVGKGRFCSASCHNSAQATGRSVDPKVRERHRVHGVKGSVRWRAQRRAAAAL